MYIANLMIFFVLIFKLKKFFFFFFFLATWQVGSLVLQSGVGPVPCAMEAQSLNHWSARECPRINDIFKISLFIFDCTGSSLLHGLFSNCGDLGTTQVEGFPGSSDSKASACSVGDPGSILGLGRSPGEANGNPLQYSCLENPMDGGALQATVHGVAKSWARLSDFTLNLGCGT